MLRRQDTEAFGWRPSAPTDVLKAGTQRDGRFRILREGAFLSNIMRQAPLERFWLSDLRRCVLFLFLLRQSRWMRGGPPGGFPFALVALRTQLSTARLAQLLEMACAAGDFARMRDPRDARQYVFEPSPAAVRLFIRIVRDLDSDQASAFGMARPCQADDSPPDGVAFAPLVDRLLDFLSLLDLRDRGVGSLCFMLALLDLHLHKPLATSDFIRREAERLKVTTVTIRNLLARAEARGWLQREGRMLRLSPSGTRRVVAGMQGFEGLLSDLALPGLTAMEPNGNPQ